MNLLMQPSFHANKCCEMVANDGNVLVESCASSPSLVSCCSLGKLIKLSNAFSFSLRLCSARLSLRSWSRFCSRCLRSCSRRTASS